MLRNLMTGFLLLAGSVYLTACDKNESAQNESAQLQIALTDDPGDYKEVWIDVKEIRINMTGQDDAGWTTLAGVNTGAYNLLDLVNDKDTVLVDAVIPTGTISQIRLVLGDNNFIITNNGEKLMLQTPSAQQSGLKLNIHQAVTGGIINKLTLDFDVAKSIVETGSGKYILKPVIRTILEAVGGNIKGVVLPDSVQTARIGDRRYGYRGQYLQCGRGIPDPWCGRRHICPAFYPYRHYAGVFCTTGCCGKSWASDGSGYRSTGQKIKVFENGECRGSLTGPWLFHFVPVPDEPFNAGWYNFILAGGYVRPAL
ncbi:DUF4382 domain-containing protein [Chitinophaga sp. XS-30]|uniref:DUF4382 domain-containing protein n=1 Tax=Chitinophaga sp. XS-30 TaxID=2604421 RepID=UPI001FED829C|nr:DUF4382 domain-containing protein [Chitinophaga sp. XS-30]